MKNLTENQKNFILEYFFKSIQFDGWRNVATKLLTSKTCIVSGKKCIWNGGIGNFIKTSVPENSVGCLLYEFDLELFLSSEWYKEIHNEYISILASKKREIETEYLDICNL